MFGGALTIPVPDVDRTDYLLVLGANPFASNGSLLDGARPSRPRSARSERVAVVSSSSIRAGRRPPRKPTNTSRSGPGPTRCSSSRCAHVLFAEDLVDARRARRPRRTGSTTSARSRKRSRPSGSPHTPESKRRRSRRIARELAGAPAAAVLRAHRHVHAGVRHARVVARRRPQRAHGQPRPAGRRDVRQARRGRRQHGRQAGHGTRRALRAPAARGCAGCPSSSASSPSSASPRRSRRPATVRSERC